MRAEFSEFSYGFAVTNELINWYGTPLVAAPVFPSLIEEGRIGGADLRLDRPGIPLFLQFKLADCMVRNNAREIKEGWFQSAPFYRMHLRSRRQSRQHELLLKLEANGGEVYYVAPAFHRTYEMNRAFMLREVILRSVFVKPSAVPPISDYDSHHIAFQSSTGGQGIFCSEPTFITIARSSDIARQIEATLSERRGQQLRDVIPALAERLDFVLHAVVERSFGQPTEYADFVKDLTPLRRIAYYAATFLDCTLYIAQARA